jgi:hypothetical protein
VGLPARSAVIVAVAIFFSSLVVTRPGGALHAATFVASGQSSATRILLYGGHPPIMRFLAPAVISAAHDRYTIADHGVRPKPRSEYVVLVILYTVAYSGVLLLLRAMFSRRVHVTQGHAWRRPIAAPPPGHRLARRARRLLAVPE